MLAGVNLIVGDHDDRLAVPLRNRQHDLLRQRVQRRGGFVEHDDIRSDEEAHGQH